MRKPKLVMVGNGMAGVRTLEELRKIAPDMYDITVFGAEPQPNYNRILLSPVLAGEMTVQDIILNDLQWYVDNGITLHLGARVTRIDRLNRSVVATGTNGQTITVDYDRLLIATGSTPFMPPFPGKDLPGVIAYRDIKDTDEMIDAAAKYRHAVVIGAGLLGLEAANGLALRGMEVTVVHKSDSIMDRQLDPTASKMLQTELEKKGMRFRMNAQTAELVAGASGRVAGVKFKDGGTIPADLVCVAAGIRPNVELAEKAGIHCSQGIVVSDTLQTYDPRVYAVGECINHRGIAYGLVAPLFEQAKVCANHLAEMGIGRYLGSVTSTKLKVTGIDVFSAGDFTGSDGTQDIVFHDPGQGIYKRIVLKDDKLVGAVLYGDTKDGAWYFQLMKDEQDISDLRDHLIFGNAHLGDMGHEGQQGTEVATAPPDAKAVCGCTDLSHDEVRKAIHQHKLLSVSDAQRHLGWKTPNGCTTCRPALNYYCLSSWPHEAIDDPQSGFINARAVAQSREGSGHAVMPGVENSLTALIAPDCDIEDLRVIGVDSGYELYIGGNGDLKPDAEHLFARVTDATEAIECGNAFIQLYREEGFYLEPTCHYLQRVGIEYIRKHVLEDTAFRKALHEKRLFALQRYKSPWTNLPPG